MRHMRIGERLEGAVFITVGVRIADALGWRGVSQIAAQASCRGVVSDPPLGEPYAQYNLRCNSK